MAEELTKEEKEEAKKAEEAKKQEEAKGGDNKPPAEAPPEKQTFTQEEVDEMIEKGITSAVEKEKKKLYDTIEKEKGKSTAAEEKLKSIDEAKKIEDEKKEKEEMDQLSADEKINILQDKFGTKIDQLQTTLKVQEKEFNHKLAMKDLDNYKLQKVQQANGKIVKEMVSGSTEEEIDKSYDAAVQKYKDIETAATKEFEKKLQAQEPPVDSGVPQPSNNARPEDDSQPKSLSAQEIASLPPEEYKKKKQEILDKYDLT